MRVDLRARTEASAQGTGGGGRGWAGRAELTTQGLWVPAWVAVGLRWKEFDFDKQRSRKTREVEIWLICGNQVSKSVINLQKLCPRIKYVGTQFSICWNLYSERSLRFFLSKHLLQPVQRDVGCESRRGKHMGGWRGEQSGGWRRSRGGCRRHGCGRRAALSLLACLDASRRRLRCTRTRTHTRTRTRIGTEMVRCADSHGVKDGVLQGAELQFLAVCADPSGSLATYAKRLKTCYM